MIKKLHKWIKGFFRKKYKYRLVKDIPDTLKPRFIYIVENNGFPWQIVMICPCGCTKLLHMNLMREYKPYWRFEVNKRNKISLYPSIHRIVGCKSHFFIRKGKIQWV